MRFFIQLFVLLLQGVLFAAVIFFTVIGISQLNIQTYKHGVDPERFAVIAMRTGDAAARVGRYCLVEHMSSQVRHYCELQTSDEWEAVVKEWPDATFRLASADGQINLPGPSGDEPRIYFQVKETIGDLQKIEVKITEVTHVDYFGYSTDGISVEPMYHRSLAYTSAVFGIIPGFILAWLLGASIRKFFGLKKGA